MANIDKLVNLKTLSVYYQRKLNVLPPYLGETYFPKNKVSSQHLKYLIQKQAAPTLSNESAPDDNSITPSNYGGFDDELFQTRFFRDSGVINEEDLMNINEAATNSDDQLLMTLLSGLYDDQSKQLLSHRARREWMSMSALSRSQIHFKDSGYVSYKSDPDFQKSGDDWNDANSNIFKDIRDAIDAMHHKGIYPNQIIMNTATFRNMQKNNKIKTTFSFPGTNTGNYMMLESNLVDAIKSEFHIYPVVYDQGYVDNNNYIQFIPDNLVILMNGPIDSNYTLTGSAGVALNQVGQTQGIGNMSFAPTPEELKARQGTLVGDLQLFDVGVAFHKFDDVKTAQTESLSTQNCLPTFPQSRSIFRMNVGPQNSGNKPQPKQQDQTQNKSNGAPAKA